jgi:hypothetical protein
MHGGPVGSGTAIIRPSSQGTLVDSINAFDDIRLPALHFSGRFTASGFASTNFETEAIPVIAAPCHSLASLV